MMKSFLLRKTAICISLEYNGRNGKLSSGRVDSIILCAPGAAYWEGTWVVAKTVLLALQNPVKEEKNELSEKRKKNQQQQLSTLTYL